MARDYTKYEVDGIDGVFGKGKLVLVVVQDYCSKNECTYDELKAVFPDEAQAGNTGVFGTLDEAKEIAKKRARHYVKDPIKLSDTKIAVSNQWGDNLPLFIETAKGLGYDISVAGETSNDATDNKSNENNAPARVEKSELELIEEKLVRGSHPWEEEYGVDDEENVGHYYALTLCAFATNTDDEGDDEEMQEIHRLMRAIWGVGEEISEEKYRERFMAVVTWYNSLAEDDMNDVYNWILYGIHKYRLLGDPPHFTNNLVQIMLIVAKVNDQLTEDEKQWILWVLGHVEWDISDEIKNELAKIGIVQDGVSSDYDQSKESTNEEASADKETEDQYPFLPSSWGVEHVVVVPLRDSMLADAKVDQMEHNNLAHFFENFGQIGIDCYEVWDGVDDQLQKFEKLGNIGVTIKSSAAKYLKDNMDDEHLSKLIWYMAEMVCNDDVIQYREYVTLRFYLDQWYSQAIDDYMGKFKNAGMTVITSPDN